MSSYEVVERGAAAGIVITASHNPWTDNGFKVKANTGGAGAPEMLAAIEATMDRHPEDELPPRRDYADAVAAGLVETFDPYPRFRDQLASIVDLERIRAAKGRLLVEPMYGSGAGWFTRLLDGAGLTVRELHTERNPYFGGVNPEPIPPNISDWLAEIPRWGADIGIAFDGDADRVGMATEQGIFVNQLQVYGLLYWYLLEVRGQIGPAVYTVTTTSMAPRLAEIFGTQAYETGVGFKYVGPKMTETSAVIGGEESGGFGFGMHIPERDGLASGLFLLDLWLTKAKRASEVLADLQALAGPSYYNRIDIRFAREGYEAVKAGTLSQLENAAPEVLAGHPVVRRLALDTQDGFKFYRDDGAWLLIRFSGTEALLRIYVEARSPQDVEALLAEGHRIAAAGVSG
jgi:phosphomannomutase